MIENGLAEFLDKVGKLNRAADKINALKSNDSIPLRVILQGAYDSTVNFDLPEGVPPYTPNKLADQEGVLIKEATKIRYFMKDFYPNLSATKRETMFIEMLERLAPKDAAMLCAIKDKKTFKGITKDHVKTAMPDLLQD